MSKKRLENSRKKIRVPWMLLGLSFVFLANPNISVIDLLPDFIGYIMICAALSKLSLVCEKLEEAKRAFAKMIFVDCFKLAAIIWAFGLDTTAYRGTSLMLVTFVLGVIELIFLIPAFIKLFDGLSTLGDYIDASSVNRHIKLFKCSYTDFMKVLSICFVAFKASLMVLPELSSLDNDELSQLEGRISLYPYVNVMRLFACALVLLAGIAWAVLMIRYFRRISKDASFNEGLLERYKLRVAGRDGFFALKDIKKGCAFFIAAIALTFDFSIEGINYIPDVLSAVMLFFAIYCFSRTVKIKSGKLYFLTVLYSIAAVLAYAADICYYGVNYPTNVLRKLALNIGFSGDFRFAVGSYISSVALCFIEAVLLIVLCAELFTELKKVVRAHTGFVSGRELDGEMEQAGRERLWKELERNFSRTLWAVFAYALTMVGYSLTEAFEAYVDVDFKPFGGRLAEYIEELVGRQIKFFDTTIELNFGFLWVLNIGAGIVLVFVALRAIDDLKYSVETKYMLQSN